MARLDRLGAAKEIIQIGAVIGGEFSYELLHAVHPIADTDLQRSLLSVADAQLLYVRGIAPDATYQFKHALIRDAAYEALLKSRRKDLHRLVAHTINEKFAVLKETQPEVLARHWTEAGETELAIAQWSKAGKVAEARSAFHEAQESYQQALAMLKLLPESAERDSRELQLSDSLILMLRVTRGWAASETVAVVKRVGTLAEKSGSLRQLIGSIIGRCLNSYIAGELAVASALADQGLELAQREVNPTLLAYLHMLEISVRHMRGDLMGVEKHFAAGLRLFDDPLFRQNPNGGAIVVFGTASHNAWMVGRAEVARQRMAKMMEAVNPANPHDLPWAEFHAAVLHGLMREMEQAATLAARVLELCEKHKFPKAAFGRLLLGAARAHSGRTTQGIALIRNGIDELLKVGNRITVTASITSLAEAQRLAGSVDEALSTVEWALQFNPDELFNRPETLRLRGELHLGSGQPHLAQSDFRDSISLARRMGAKAWELRTTMSLVRLLAPQGRRDEARAALAEIYGWFTEGFDTPDLKDAKALLDELAT